MTDLLTGVDLSHAAWLESRGAVYRDASGPRDPFALCREAGHRLVRLRVYAGDAAAAAENPFDCEPVLTGLVGLARRARQAGLGIMLDLHYADSWADPQHQPTPPDWLGLPAAALADAVAAHGREVMQALAAADAWPELVQVGNEITNGMLWPHGLIAADGGDPAAWDRLAALLHAAVRGIRSVPGPSIPRLVLHLDRGGDWAATRRFLDRIGERGVPWDVLAQSYYPFWHGPPERLDECLRESALRYRRPVILAEVASHHEASASEAGGGFEPSPAGQVAFLRRMVQAVRAVPGGLGLGVVWWGAEYAPAFVLPHPRLNARSCFDRQGIALPVLYELGRSAVI